MVELPTGKMKSREGTVVDADDLLDEMKATSKKHTEDLGKVKDFTAEELEQLYETISIGAVKFYLLRVDPKKKMVFNPEESIDFHGFTGPFVQYTYARIKSVLKKVESRPQSSALSPQREILTDDRRPMTDDQLLPLEKELILTLEQYSTAVEQAAIELNPSVIANYIFNLAKTFNSFYTDHSITNAESIEKKQLRLRIAGMTANVIKSSMELLGIEVPERM
jgi:arginyl-tRNA synthetase